MKWMLATALIACAYPSTVTAQSAARPAEGGRVALAADSVPTSVADAESRAQRRRGSAAIDSLPLQSIPLPVVGTSERRCVTVSREAQARSGDFIAAGFGLYQDLWVRGYGKIAWFPVHASQSSPKDMTVTATRLDAGTDGRVWEAHFTRGAYYMYPSGIHVPSAGRWMLVATAGDMWGCFILTVR